ASRASHVLIKHHYQTNCVTCAGISLRIRTTARSIRSERAHRIFHCIGLVERLQDNLALKFTEALTLLIAPAQQSASENTSQRRYERKQHRRNCHQGGEDVHVPMMA